MRRKLFLLLALVLGGALYAAKAQDSASADAERYIKECERIWAESVATGETSALEQFLADDFVGVDPEGSHYDKAKEIAHTKAGYQEFLSNHLDEVKVRFYGDAAVAQGTESWVRRTQKPASGKFVWTDTWIKRNGKWQIVAAEDLVVAGRGD